MSSVKGKKLCSKCSVIHLCKLIERHVEKPEPGGEGQALQGDSLQLVVAEVQILQVGKIVKHFRSYFLQRIMAEVQIHQSLIVFKSGCMKIFNSIVRNIHGL